MRNYHKQDYLLAITTFLLVIFGLIMVSSASVVQSYTVSGTNNYYLLRQGGYAIVGLLAWWICSKLDYHFWRRFATIALGAGLVMLVAVLIPGIGVTAGGAHRWIGIGSFTLQASEFVKFGLIVYLAYWFENKGSRIGDWYGTVLPFIGMLLVVFALIMSEPDLGTAMVVAGIAITMFFVAGARVQHIGLLLCVALVGVVALIIAEPYRFERLMTFLNPEADPLGAGYHFNQGLIAIGSGGLFGLGYGHSRQKFLYLPEAASDSIFAIIGEELGFVGAIFFVLLPFTILIWRGLMIARTAPDNFGRLLAFGITTWLGLQAILNVGAIVGLIPLTGVPLPFISLGGTALVFNLVAAGVLLNISKQTINSTRDENPFSWWWQWWSYYTNASRRRVAKN